MHTTLHHSTVVYCTVRFIHKWNTLEAQRLVQVQQSYNFKKVGTSSVRHKGLCIKDSFQAHVS